MRSIALRMRNSSSSPSGFSSLSKSKLPRPVAWYAKKLDTNPLITKCVTSGIVAGSGDLICQYIIHWKQGNRDGGETSFVPDWIRTGRFSLLGFGLIAPVVHHWYGFLMTKLPGNTITAAFQRLFCEQILFAPLFIPTFMTSLMMLEGKDISSISSILEREAPAVVVSNWSLWIPAMFINFRFIPAPWQVLYSNCVGLIWNAYLSWKTQVDIKK